MFGPRPVCRKTPLPLGLVVLLMLIYTSKLSAQGNRLAHLDVNDPYHVGLDSPKLITPQWVGEKGVEAVVILAIDDMRDPARYEAFLRPVLQRLKRIDGRAPVSIMTNSVRPDDPQLQSWLGEGLSIEAHTIDHPCPLLRGGDFARAKSTYDRCVDLLSKIPGNRPVAFRMPCCDSLNTVSPRFFSEIFNRTTATGRYLQIDTSVFNVFTSDDPDIPRELVQDADGSERFLKYIPRNSGGPYDAFVNTIRNYPYPYIINRTCWEFPCLAPSDWEGQNLHGNNNPKTLEDWKAALDITVIKQGVMCLVFHPHGWIRNGQLIDGTGIPWFQADVAIRGDRIVKIERQLEGTGRREIDATGLMVAPGFIDMHSHSDSSLLVDGNAQSKIRQGVTTEILGEGSSAAPNLGRRPARSATVDGQTVRWKTLAEYFALLEKSGIATNVASYVGLNNAWEAVMGKSFDRPTPEQLKAMEEIIRQGMDDGALGLSSQVMMPPGSLARTEEITQLARVVRPYGGIFSIHIRNEGTGVFGSIEEAITVAENADVPVDIIHLKIADEEYWGRMPEIIAIIEAARQRNVNVQANVYPYTRGNNNLRSIIPPWAHEGGNAAMLKRLADPQSRSRIKRDIVKGVEGWYNHYTAVGGDWGRMLVAGDNRFKGLTMDRVMALRTAGKKNADLLDELLDLPQGEVCVAVAVTDTGSVMFFLLIDFGDRIATTDKLLGRLDELVLAAGGSVEKEMVSETEVIVYDNPIDDNSPEVIIKDGTLVVTTNRLMTEHVVAHWEGTATAEQRTFSQNRKFTAIMRSSVGTEEARPHASWYFDPLTLVTATTQGNFAAQAAMAILPTIGLDGFKALGGSVILAPPGFSSFRPPGTDRRPPWMAPGGGDGQTDTADRPAA